MKEAPIMIPIGELVRRTGRNRKTVREWLQAKGIVPHGRSLLMDDIRVKWPPMHSAILFAMGIVPPCPQCGTPMRCECPVCDVSFGF